MKLGTLYGVGVGPGDPDLLTLRAVKVLREVPALAIPQSHPSRASMAWRTCRDVIGDIPGQDRMFITFPMTRDPEVLRPAWDAALAQIGAHLMAGRSVAFPTVGDPFTYSTYIYMHREVGERWPDVPRVVVPGVSSITAVPVAAGVPLGDGMERIAVVPAGYGLEDLDEVLKRFDTTVVMKVGRSLPELRRRLTSAGLLDKSVYVSRATTADEVVQRNLAELPADTCDYFSTVVVRRGDRAGALAGEGRADLPPLQGGTQTGGPA